MANKPKPTALRVLEGNPSKRPLPENEPKLETAIPRTPRHLSAVAKKHFPKIAKQLADAGVMTTLDAQALAIYCESYALWIDANQKIVEDGAIVYSAQGVPQQSPYVLISMKAGETMRKLLIEFGMTPSARTRVSTVPKESDQADPWSKV